MKGLVLTMAGLASAAAQHPASDMTCAFSQRLKFLACKMLTPWACAGLNATTLTVGGKAFTDTANFWNRLPAAAKGVVQPPSVWGLSQQSAVRLVLCASHVPVAAGCCCCCLYLPA